MKKDKSAHPLAKLVSFLSPYKAKAKTRKAPKAKTSKYTRHQGEQEKARRLRQRQKGVIQ